MNPSQQTNVTRPWHFLPRLQQTRGVVLGLSTLLLTACNASAPLGQARHSSAPPQGIAHSAPQAPMPAAGHAPDNQGIIPVAAWQVDEFGNPINGDINGDPNAGLPAGPNGPPLPPYVDGAPCDTSIDPTMARQYGAPPPLPYNVTTGNWAPPGIARPWPEDEYLHDGGDMGPPAEVAPDWELYGVQLEDTIAHYDTLDGRTLVEPSNRVDIYAPRFGAVRKVTRLTVNEFAQGAVGMAQPTAIIGATESLAANTTLQRTQLGNDVGTAMSSQYQGNLGDGMVSLALSPDGFQDAFLPFENLELIRTGKYHNGEKPRLSQANLAAITWSNNQMAQVSIDQQAAQGFTGDQSAGVIYTVKDLRDSPKLRVIKVASTQTANPGDIIDFTIRFDNVGDQPIGNIVIVDSLTTRLEYVPDSVQSSVPAAFSHEPNEGDSLRLRWEITEKPLEPGEGGIVRFQCVVR